MGSVLFHPRLPGRVSEPFFLRGLWSVNSTNMLLVSASKLYFN